MYDGYAWLTNVIATDLLRFRLLLLGGMGGFLVIALAIPSAFEGEGLAFGVAFVAVVVLHTGMYMRGASLAEAKVMLRIGSYNLVAATLVLVGGALGGDAQWVLWGLACLVWLTPWLARLDDMVVTPSHFVERHGLVIIVALGESVVVIGIGAAAIPIDARLVLVALLALALSASLWWLYFRHEDAVEQAMRTAEQARRARLALLGFGYWHYGLLLGVVAVAAGMKKAIGEPYDDLGGWISVELAAGVALFLWCSVGFCRTLGLDTSVVRLVAGGVALATVPIGTEWTAAAQLAVLTAIVAAALVAEGRRGFAQQS
jgi:low temperature requirement protein LtrA